jgi:hypothetical protein
MRRHLIIQVGAIIKTDVFHVRDNIERRTGKLGGPGIGAHWLDFGNGSKPEVLTRSASSPPFPESRQVQPVHMSSKQDLQNAGYLTGLTTARGWLCHFDSRSKARFNRQL